MRSLLLLLLFLSPLVVCSQPNCNLYLLENDSTCYRACELANTQGGGSQGSRWSQEKYAKAFSMCPELDFAIYEQAVPYLKRGDLATWKQMIDQAVALNPRHLGYRGWCRYQFARDYTGAIKDIESLERIFPGQDIGYCVTGDYHLKVALALCYKMVGNREKAIALIEEQLAESNYLPMTFDYLHLGVLYYEVGNLSKAEEALKKSIEINDYLAENYYYLGLVVKAQGKDSDHQQKMMMALSYYEKGYRLMDVYSHPVDKIFMSHLNSELEN